ncbi:MAG: M50 family metallopeptidase, partial [Nannocystaceae bacterium]|nr:M50 family metallopeptidase [Nannocystaceae bacterium]
MDALLDRPRRDPALRLGRRDGEVWGLGRTGELVALGELECVLLELADGTRTVPQIAAAAGEILGGELEPLSAAAYFDQARALGLVAGGRARPPGAAGGRFALTLPLWNPERWLTRVRVPFAALASRGGLAMLGLLGWWAVSVELDRPWPAPERLLEPAALATFWLAWAIAVLSHELAHALTSMHLGAPVRRMGVGLLAGVLPFAWADVTPSCLLPRRRDRLWVIAAGALGTGVVVALACVLATAWPPGDAIAAGLRLFAATALVGAAINAAPLLRLDGYYALTELLAQPQLRTVAWQWSRDVIASLLLGAARSVSLSPRQRVIVPAFACASLLAVAWLLAWGGAWWWHTVVAPWRGLGLVALSLAAAWLLAPGVRAGWRRRRRLHREGAWRGRVAAARLALALVAVSALGSIETDERIEATFTLEPAAAQVVRAAVPGLLPPLTLRGGQAVARGQVLAQLHDPALVRAHAVALAELQRAELARA